MNRSLVRRYSSPALMLSALSSLALAACFPVGSDDFGYDAYNEIFVSATPPPAISGGTLLVTNDGTTAVAADPDRDRIFIADLTSSSLRAEIALDDGAEPGRVAEDGAGRAFVALRGQGKLVTIDIAQGKLIETRDVCAAPRGIAYDAGKDALHVACAGGELVTLPAKGGEPTAVRKLDVDLRDVVIDGDKLLVSRFKSAELLVVEKDGAVSERRTLPSFTPTIFPEQKFEPTVAWRTIPKPNGGALMVHQRSTASEVKLDTPGAYYSTAGCDSSIVNSAVSEFGSPSSGTKAVTEDAPSETIPNVALPVDVAVSTDGKTGAIVGAGQDVVVTYDLEDIEAEAGNQNCTPNIKTQDLMGQPTSVAALPDGGFLIQLREPAMLVTTKGAKPIQLSSSSRKDTAFEMFHRPPTGFSSVACASCHPSGQEDGHVWHFNTIGARRTQNIAIAGGISQTAPFHWSGDLNDMGSLMGEVFVNRMSGQAIGPRRMNAFTRWVDKLREVPIAAPSDAAAAERGRALFNDEKVACATCHVGELMTNNKSEDVGTGEKLQVPSLRRISLRAPFMHDGCAKTLRDRFTGACGGGDKHGVTSHLTEAQLNDLIVFLESL